MSIFAIIFIQLYQSDLNTFKINKIQMFIVPRIIKVDKKASADIGV